MPLPMHSMLIVLIVCQTTFTLLGQDLATSLNNLKDSLVGLEQVLNPGLPDEYSKWFAQLSDPQKQELLKLSPDQLATLLAGQSASAAGAPPPPAAPGKMPPPPPPGPGKGPRPSSTKPQQILSDEEKIRAKKEYEAKIDQDLTSSSPDETINYLRIKKGYLEKTINRVEKNLEGLSGQDLYEEKKKLETVRAQLEVLKLRLKPFEVKLQKEASGQENLQKELKEKILKRAQSMPAQMD